MLQIDKRGSQCVEGGLESGVAAVLSATVISKSRESSGVSDIWEECHLCLQFTSLLGVQHTRLVVATNLEERSSFVVIITRHLRVLLVVYFSEEEDPRGNKVWSEGGKRLPRMKRKVHTV